jgi:hypothetical protein
MLSIEATAMFAEFRPTHEKVLTPRHRHSAMEQRFDADFQIVDRQNVKKMNERYLR